MTVRFRLKPGFFVILALLLLLDDALPWLLLVTVAVHELGHLLALQCLGVDRATLTLGPGGGVIDCAPLDRRQLALTALAGPLASLLWALLLLRPAPMAALLSLAVGCFNLLPVPPLDGGMALRAAAGETAAKAASALSLGALLALSLLLQPLLGWWVVAVAGWTGVRTAAAAAARSKE